MSRKCCIDPDTLPALGSQRLLAPSPGGTILDPAQRYTPLPAEGRRVVVDQYWIRRLMDGGVVDKTPQPPKPAPAAPREEK